MLLAKLLMGSERSSRSNRGKMGLEKSGSGVGHVYKKLRNSSCAFAKRRQCTSLGNRGVEQSGSSSGS